VTKKKLAKKKNSKTNQGRKLDAKETKGNSETHQTGAAFGGKGGAKDASKTTASKRREKFHYKGGIIRNWKKIG